MKTLIIDNAGFDVMAMAAMTEKDFVTLHLENDSIAKHKPEEERVQYLKKCYAAIKAEAKPAESVKKKPADTKPE